MLKKMISLLLVCILSLSGCSSYPTDTLSSDDSSVQQSAVDTSKHTILPDATSFLTYCGSDGGSKFEANSINCADLLNNLNISDPDEVVYHLPVLQIDNRLGIQKFTDEYDGLFQLDNTISGVPTFVAITDDMDDEYFNSYSLLIVYIKDSVTSKSLEISHISKDEQSVVVHISQSDDISEISQMGRLMIIPIEKHMIGENVSADAILDN